ncbi:TPA: DEAD/DEAH box helicase [Enterobacter hormaechei]|uniref:DEAD/DEAH box helicase n=1 Tax=Enterobacter cloacae complex TaxID=354276 RepID=UPI0018C2DDB2|nr:MULTISPECIES: DEAD/DEAH box helicase family protein [Enterobacter cloacae complex]MBG0666184.1 DEAD/DEAH box helicase family protein [Enterobacter hormaechei]MCQ4390128.1 DEAD/DEAH box helicase family protein [Enterobacter roggenkampii]MCY0806161.1 DEAD/DEAH box helicase family protein [Enterobacter cloacae complex sp. 2022EL-00747]HCI5427952.1 DEAD/DEAH box helicase family protein [Enterobacter hormaechei]HDR2384456.1 DEAD/DEAH box helicase family protein [Enterobacter roggenkampii]
MSYFFDTAVNIEGNTKLRAPQIEAYIKIKDFFSDEENKEALVVLPTGTGKSGLISIAPFGVAHKKVLIITPGLITKDSIRKTQEVLADNFWVNFDIVFSSKDIPIVNEYSADLSDEHLLSSHIVYSNIQKVTSTRDNALTNRVPSDFFDLIIIDEAHHAPAQSWRDTLHYFSNAKILHVTGTPYRGDNQEIPGVRIHETPLSEVMRDKYVKWLRKETVNAHELFFSTPEQPGVKLSKEQILMLKDKEWIEKSIALSKECSLDVIDHSIIKLHELKEASPTVPHKILAVGCSIAHAEDLLTWYKERGINSVIVHSEMELSELTEALLKVEHHQCDVVISVNMLMEGYDHKYLTVLAIFRPYRSLNAFAQVVGRILRAIPESEITHFEIDNNGIVIFHEEIGLNVMWENFQKEVDRARRASVREYTFTDRDYVERSSELAGVESDSAYISDSDSYLHDIDFNALFKQKRNEISDSVTQQIEKIRQSGVDLPEDALEALRQTLAEKAVQKAAEIIDPELIEKRPHQARKLMREILKTRTQDAVANMLIDNNIGEKSSELYDIFKRYVPYLKTTDANDGILVRYVNIKLASAYGPVVKRDNKTLLQSIKDLDKILAEVERMIK